MTYPSWVGEKDSDDGFYEDDCGNPIMCERCGLKATQTIDDSGWHYYCSDKCEYAPVAPGTLFNIPRAGGEVRLRAVAPGDAHESDWGFVTEPEPVTQPTAFPAAPAAPELCKLAYYGIRCDIKGCQDEVHTRRRNP